MKMIKMVIFGENSGIQAIYGENYQRVPQKKPWPLCIQSVGISQRDQPWQRQPQISQDLHQKRGVDRPELPRLGKSHRA